MSYILLIGYHTSVGPQYTQTSVCAHKSSYYIHAHTATNSSMTLIATYNTCMQVYYHRLYKRLMYGITYVASLATYLRTWYSSTIARTCTRIQTVLQLLMQTYTRRILRCELVFVSDSFKLEEDVCVYPHTGRRLQKCRHTRTPSQQSPLLSLLDSQIDNHLQDLCLRRQSP